MNSIRARVLAHSSVRTYVHNVIELSAYAATPHHAAVHGPVLATGLHRRSRVRVELKSLSQPDLQRSLPANHLCSPPGHRVTYRSTNSWPHKLDIILTIIRSNISALTSPPLPTAAATTVTATTALVRLGILTCLPPHTSRRKVADSSPSYPLHLRCRESSWSPPRQWISTSPLRPLRPPHTSTSSSAHPHPKPLPHHATNPPSSPPPTSPS